MNILLDTSFFIPIIGLEIKNTYVIQGIQILYEQRSQYKLYYSEMTLLELSWVFLKEKKRLHLDHKTSFTTFKNGLLSIEQQFTKIPITAEHFIEALHLKSLEHQDIFDNLSFSVSKSNQIYFLTIDKKFSNFLIDNNQNMDFFLLCSDFLDQG